MYALVSRLGPTFNITGPDLQTMRDILNQEFKNHLDPLDKNFVDDQMLSDMAAYFDMN